MRGPVSSFACAFSTVAAGTIVSLVFGCASPVEVSYDERLDFSRFRTWDWMPGEAISVDVRVEEAPGLERDLTRAVARALEARGLERGAGRADLRVGAALKVWHAVEVVQRTGALQTLNSYHNTHSFEIQSAETRRTRVERFALQIHVVDPAQGRVIWRGRLGDRFTAGTSDGLDLVVDQLLEGFPPR